MTGDRSCHVDATVHFNGRLQPSKCTWMKLQEASSPIEEQPLKVAEALKLFLQGLGYVVKQKRVNVTITKKEEEKQKVEDLLQLSAQNVA